MNKMSADGYLWMVGATGAAWVAATMLVTAKVGSKVKVSFLNWLTNIKNFLSQTGWPKLKRRAPSLFETILNRKKLKKIDKNFPETLESLADVLVAGYSLEQATLLLAEDLPTPVNRVFRAARRGISYGLPLGESLRLVDQHLNLPAFTNLCEILQSDLVYGGNCVPNLRTYAKTIRDEQKNLVELTTLTSGGRASGALISVLMPLVLIFFWLLSPDYLTLLFNTTLGRIFFGLSIVLELVGITWIRQIVRVL